jgi:hypothetical protein
VDRTGPDYGILSCDARLKNSKGPSTHMRNDGIVPPYAYQYRNGNGNTGGPTLQPHRVPPHLSMYTYDTGSSSFNLFSFRSTQLFILSHMPVFHILYGLLQ